MTAYSSNGKQIIEDNSGIHHEYYECKCCSGEHVVRMTYFTEDEDAMGMIEDGVYLSVYLPDQSFWRRLIDGVKYIFGHKSVYGHFDEVELTLRDSKRFRDLLNRYIDSGHSVLKEDIPNE